MGQSFIFGQYISSDLAHLLKRDSLLSTTLYFLIGFPFVPLTFAVVEFAMAANEDEAIDAVDEMQPERERERIKAAWA